MSRLGFRQRYRPSVVSIPGRANLCYRVFGTPAPAPRIMIAADTKSIELDGDVVRIRAEYDLTDRIAHLDARPPRGRTLHGHSLARWQDDVQIVETSNFTANPICITDGLPSSAEKHLVE